MAGMWRNRTCAIGIATIAAVVVLWAATTAVFWVGYAGVDDLFYARYAFLLHRPPINWWEFRLPAILALKASFAALGPSEFAAAVPTLFSSLLILGCVAWQVRGVTRPSWASTLALVLAATLPLDVGFRSVPLAGYVATALFVLGCVCILRGRGRVPLVGAISFAAAFLTHEVSFFYVVIFCLALLIVSPARFWRPVALCVVLSGAAFVLEGVAYHVVLGDFFARFRTAAGATNSPIGTDLDTTVRGGMFFLWPIANLVFCKAFGIDLILLVVGGAFAWRRLEPEQRILLWFMFGLYLWLGFGTMLPWAYRPFYRQFHYYFPIGFGIVCVLPFALQRAWEHRVRLAQSLAAVAVVIHLLSLAAGGRWGQEVDVSRALGRYADRHPDHTFLTDVVTMNHLYVLHGFRLPVNVVCVDGPSIDRLLVNKEPPASRRITFSTTPVDGVLVNRDVVSHMIRGDAPTVMPPEAEFLRFLATHPGEQVRIAPVRYRLLFEPFMRFVEPRAFMVRTLGGEVVQLHQERER